MLPASRVMLHGASIWNGLLQGCGRPHPRMWTPTCRKKGMHIAPYMYFFYCTIFERKSRKDLQLVRLGKQKSRSMEAFRSFLPPTFVKYKGKHVAPCLNQINQGSRIARIERTNEGLRTLQHSTSLFFSNLAER